MANYEIVLLRGHRYVVDQCGCCGILYVVPEKVHEHHADHGGYSSCSNGHQWGWSEGRLQRDALRQERDRLKQENARLEDERVAAVREAHEIKKKYLKRAAAGVCPCCNRTFLDLQRHMKTKHPNVVPLDQKTG